MSARRSTIRRVRRSFDRLVPTRPWAPPARPHSCCESGRAVRREGVVQRRTSRRRRATERRRDSIATSRSCTRYGAYCVTVTVWPAIVSVPVLTGPAFALTATLTVPLPVPLLPAVIVMNDALLIAVQGGVHAVVTAMTPVPPLDRTLTLVGDTT